MGFNESLEKMIGLATGSRDPIAMSAVMEVQKELIKIQEENRNLRLKVHELENERILDSELEFHGGVYTRKSDKRKFCAKCWDNDKKLNSVIEHDMYGYWCSTCKFGYPYIENPK